jgi:hypothetical protein
LAFKACPVMAAEPSCLGQWHFELSLAVPAGPQP